MADTTINVRVKNKYDTEANWTSKNPVLLLGEIAVSSDKNSKYKVGDGKSTWSQLKYAYQADLDTKLPISGGTMTGALNLANNTWNRIGNDCYLGDKNQAGCVCIRGINGSTGLYFEPYSGSTSQKLSINGSGTMNVTENFSVAKNLNVGGQITGNDTVTAPNLSVSGSIRNLDHHGGGIFWNPYVESDTDSSDAASITVIKDGNGTNGTVLQIKQANDAADIVNVVTASNDGLKVNKNTVLTAANYNNYKPSTAGTADYANLLNLYATSSTVTTNKSTWRNGVTTGTIVWGQWWKDTSLTNDTGDVCLWLEKSGSQTILNAIIDGYIRAVGGFKGNLFGNASTSTKLATARKINGVSFDGSGDITVGVDPANIADGYTKNSFYINTHPENNPTVIPFINNDIAFLLKRGGSAVVKYDDVIQNVDISNVFDGSPSYWSIGSVDTTSVKTITMELTLHKVFSCTNIIYVDFGCYSFGAKDIKFEVMNSNYPNDVWTQRGIITDNPCGEYKVIMSHTPVGSTSGAGGGFNKIKFTFTNFNRSGVNAFRIACLGVINYGSSGIREICLPKDGGSLYGGIYPYSNKGATLGTSSNQWSNVYTDTVTASGNVTVGGNLTVTGTVSGTANKAVALTSSAGSTTNPVYFSGGKPYACGYTINTSVPSGAVFTDKNTRQYPIANLSTETNWRPLLMGNSSSATEGFTPSDVTNMCLTASNLSVQPSTGTVKANIFKGEEVKLSDKCTLKYDSTEECVSFVFG